MRQHIHQHGGWVLGTLLSAIVLSGICYLGWNALDHGILGSHSTLKLIFLTQQAGKTAKPSPSPVRSLSRRGTSCAGNGKGAPPGYDTPLHVGALLIILFVSTAACAFPMLVIRFPRLHIPASFLFVVRHFGTGVLIATAFCHLLPTAFISLGDPCLSSFWTEDYEAMPGAIALAAIFLVTVVEMIFSPAQHLCGGGANVKKLGGSKENADVSGSKEQTDDEVQGNQSADVATDPNMRRERPLVGRSSSMGRGLAHLNDELNTWDRIEESQNVHQRIETTKDVIDEDAMYYSPPGTWLTPEQKYKKALMQCMLLEMGILFHSVFIGMTLSVTVGNDFVILLIAIAFHRMFSSRARALIIPFHSILFTFTHLFMLTIFTETFEGLALGSRIAALEWDKKAAQPWLMALAYGCTYVFFRTFFEINYIY